MSKKDDALKLALEALELEDLACRYEKDPTPEHIAQAIAAIREALTEQPAQQPAQQPITGLDVYLDPADELKPKLYSPQPAQEPHMVVTVNHKQAFVEGLMPQQQEPVAFSQFLSDVVTAAGLLSHGKTDKSLAARISEFAFRLRTSPPASKPWVGLTDVEWMNIVNKDHAWFGQRPEDVAHEVAKLVEAKLREKNS